MKFGVREICDVVLRAKSAQKIGNKVFYKNEPVIYFDSLKTSSMEGAATTVYAQGGRGNARLIAWEGERTVTFTMEDALISPMGFSVLTGAGLIDAQEKSIITHRTEQTDNVVKAENYVQITLTEKPYVGDATEPVYTKAVGDFDSAETYYTKEGNVYTVVAVPTADDIATYYVKGIQPAVDDSVDYIYVMRLDDNGEIISEPYIASEVGADIQSADGGYTIKIYATDDNKSDKTTYWSKTDSATNSRKNNITDFNTGDTVLVDYYVKRTSGAFEIDITPDKFGGNFYLEASTLFRATNGVDMPAEFIIPNCKIQSNFTFTMASSGDPSTFTFTMDAFPDYTRWDKTKKVYAAIQVVEESDTLTAFERLGTPHNYGEGNAYNTKQKPYIEID